MNTVPLLGNRHERRSHMGMRRYRERLPNAVLPSRGIRTHVSSPVLDSLHLLQHQADNLRVTSYCDNSSLLKAEKTPHEGRGLVQLVPKPDHDVIMTHEGLPSTHLTACKESRRRARLC
jgi:hypothetical protein